MPNIRVIALSCAATIGVLGFTSPASATPILLNGGFEAGGGSLSGWTVVDQLGGSGDWYVQSGTSSPTNGFSVPAPPGGTHAAMTGQPGLAGSHVLYQDFVVPAGVTAANLSFQELVANRAGAFSTPASLDDSTGPNQQARVDIMLPSATPFSLAPGDILLNVFQTNVGDPLVSGYNPISKDLTALLAAQEGHTLRLRFAEADNQGDIQFGADQVNLDVTADPLHVTAPAPAPVPEPASLVLFGTGLMALARRFVRRRHAA